MGIKGLEINGFKSFAKKAHLEFSAPIVSIVGPNGSGKSNVAEAFRFVLGEQSMKSMRGKRGEDLIWNGSKTTPKMNRASVKLIFDNKDRKFNVDFDEVVIERAVHRDGVNEYAINGSLVRLRDILELLASANIGASGHHIISQGEADRILTASIKERKSMIEDALGLKVYQYKREESQKKLEKTAENIKQVESLRREIAPHIKFLEKQVEKVEKALNLKKELFVLYQEYLSREEKYIHETKINFERERSIPENELKIIENKIEESRRLIEKTERDDEGAMEVLNIETSLQEAEKEETLCRSALSRVEGEIAAAERMLRRSNIEDSVHVSTSVSLKEVETLSEHLESIAEASKSNDNVQFLKAIIERLVVSLKNFVSERRERTPEADKKHNFEEELRQLEEIRHETAIKLDNTISKVKNIKDRYNELRKKREEENIRGREAERELYVLMSRRTELTSLIYQIKNKEELHKKEEDQFKAEIVEAQALIGHEVLRYSGLDIHIPEDRNAQIERKKKLERLKIKFEEAGAAGGEELKKEYEETLGRDNFLAKEIEDLEKSAESLKVLIAELEDKLQTEFKVGMDKINTVFSKFFDLMFGGGNASLEVIKEEKRRRKSEFDELSESLDPQIPEEVESEEGIEVSVSLPHKRIKGLSMLSGGERALTSIALLFAISQVNPPPFIILDETDAALDEANSRKYGDMVENLAKNSQLIVITHNRETMSRAEILYGVTMGSDGFSKILSVRFDEAVAVAK